VKLTRSTRPASRDEPTEQRILEAAARVFLRRGTAGARMQEIAAEAGVNHALLHYYYRTKDRLAESVFVRSASELMPALIGLMTSDAPLEEKVERAIALELGHLARNPLLPAYLISELNHHPERVQQLFTAMAGMEPARVGRTVLRVLRAQIDERVRQGTMRAITPEQFMVNLLSLCIFPFAARPLLSAVLGLDAKAFDRFIEQRREALPVFFLNGLRP
jgi:TetR/AcrR family transcriptional regulator